jgi:hypothetical protein
MSTTPEGRVQHLLLMFATLHLQFFFFYTQHRSIFAYFSPPLGGDEHSPVDGCDPGSVGYKINYRYLFLHSMCSILETVFVQTLKDSKLRYHHLFETFRNDALFMDAEVKVIPDVNNPLGLLTSSKLNEKHHQKLVVLIPAQPTTCVDRLFSFHFDPNPTEKPEEMNLPGLDQLPAETDHQIQRILGYEKSRIRSRQRQS